MTEQPASPDEYHKRRNNLTAEDLENITAIFDSIHYTRQHNLSEHECRFANIQPKDLEEMVETHKKLAEIVTDSKNVVRRTILGILVVIFMGIMTKGFWTRMKEALIP